MSLSFHFQVLNLLLFILHDGVILKGRRYLDIGKVIAHVVVQRLLEISLMALGAQD